MFAQTKLLHFLSITFVDFEDYYHKLVQPVFILIPSDDKKRLLILAIEAITIRGNQTILGKKQSIRNNQK